MTDAKRFSRRAALARIGLTGFAAYVAPSIVGLSQARAATQPSPPSAPSVVSAPSGPRDSGSLSRSNTGPSGPGACRVPHSAGPAQISRQEYQNAQRAISRGEARPLRDVMNSVLQEYPGRLVQVGYSETGPAPLYRLQIVGQRGDMLAISVNASSGQIINVRTC